MSHDRMKLYLINIFVLCILTTYGDPLEHKRAVATSSQDVDMASNITAYEDTELLDPAENPATNFKYQGVSYKFVTGGMNFAQSEKKCQELNGHLVSITSEDINDAIKDHVMKYEDDASLQEMYMWIGYKYQDPSWRWTNPSAPTSTYTNWREGPFPERGFHCAHMIMKIEGSQNPDRVGRWDSVSCKQSEGMLMYYTALCEIGKSKEDDAVSYGPWGKWSRCTEPCDGGEQTRHRKCSGPKELCEHRIITDTRECNNVKCTFPRQNAGDVKYFEVNEGMCLSPLDKEACGKIAIATGSKLMEIVNEDLWYFPQGCYITVNHNIFFYNTHASTKRCDEDRKCICNLALGRNELVDWVYGEENINVDQKTKKREVNEANDANARKRHVVEKNDNVKMRYRIKKDAQTIPFELMDKF